MTTATVHATHAGRCRIHINSSGFTPWCQFDYVVEPDHDSSDIHIEIGEAPDNETAQWFPFVKKGIEDGLQDLRQHEEIELVHMRVRIDRVFSHPVDTTEAGCERYGKLWIGGFGRSDSVKSLSD